MPPSFRGVVLLLLSTTWFGLLANASRSVLGTYSQASSNPLPVPISHLSTGVAAARSRFRLNGAGIKIAIMDSGINWKHPAFGGCKKLGAGGTCRVVKGWDFVGDAKSGKYKPDSDPMECNAVDDSHGTEVASVAAGDASFDKQRPWRGVAYKSSILGYKVSGTCSGDGLSTNASLQAIRQATKDDADVLNLSYGDFRAGSYVDRRYAAALGAAMERGALVAIASGNDGDYGPWFTEGGVAAPGVLSTAAVDMGITVSGMDLSVNPPLQINGTKRGTIKAIPPLMLTSADLASMPRLVRNYESVRFPLKIVPAKPLNGCVPITNTAELKGGIALMIRGNCTFYAKAAAAAKAGAVAAIVYNNRTGPWLGLGFDAAPIIPTWGMTIQEGQAILTMYGRSGESTKLQREQTQPKPPNRHQPLQVTRSRLESAAARPEGVFITGMKWRDRQKYNVTVEPAFFSSWGPAATLEMLPSISAPGSGMRAASAGSNYTAVDGTSFAAPFVAGSLALWRQARSEYWQEKSRTQLESHRNTVQSGAGRVPIHVARNHSKSNKHKNVDVASKGTNTAKAAADTAFRTNESTQAVMSGQRQQHAPQGDAVDSYKSLTAVHSIKAANGPAASLPSNMMLGAQIKDPMKGFGVSGSTQQAAAYASFVSTARPIEWSAKTGWVQPVARVGAGLIQVDAAIENPTRTAPTHVLLRSNQPSQTQSITFTNAGASFPVTYNLGHKTAAAISLKDTWYITDPEALLQPLAASVRFTMGERVVTTITVQSGQTVKVQVTFSLPKQLQSGPYLYSGYITATPTRSTSGITTERSLQDRRQGDTKRLTSLAGFSGTLPYRPVPLVVPYQGFSQNYTNLPLLPQQNMRQYPQKTKEGLKSLLRVCYAGFAQDFYGELDYESELSGKNQDGYLYQPHVDRCISQAADPAAVYKLTLKFLQQGFGVLMVSAALTRPAVRMQLMLFEADKCQGNTTGCIGGYKRGQLVGEVWRYWQPSRDFPTTMWAYYGYDFEGQVKLYDAKTDKLMGTKQVQRNKLYKFQLWLVGPLAAADRAAGEQYKTWKHDSPGTYMFE